MRCESRSTATRRSAAAATTNAGNASGVRIVCAPSANATIAHARPLSTGVRRKYAAAPAAARLAAIAASPTCGIGVAGSHGRLASGAYDPVHRRRAARSGDPRHERGRPSQHQRADRAVHVHDAAFLQPGERGKTRGHEHAAARVERARGERVGAGLDRRTVGVVRQRRSPRPRTRCGRGRRRPRGARRPRARPTARTSSARRATPGSPPGGARARTRRRAAPREGRVRAAIAAAAWRAMVPRGG